MSIGIIHTFSGKQINLLDPHPDMIVWDDVFRAMSYENRYNGHTSQPFSVGQHTLAMSMYLTDATVTVRRVALIHDFPEYVLKDVVAPLKPLVGGAYGRLTVAWENAFCEKLGIFSGPQMRSIMEDSVKEIDHLCWLAEAQLLQPNRPSSIPQCTDTDMLSCVTSAANYSPEAVQKGLANYMKELF